MHAVVKVNSSSSEPKPKPEPQPQPQPEPLSCPAHEAIEPAQFDRFAARAWLLTTCATGGGSQTNQSNTFTVPPSKST